MDTPPPPSSPPPPIATLPPSSGSGGSAEGPDEMRTTTGSAEGFTGFTTGASSKPRARNDTREGGENFAKAFSMLIRKVMAKKYAKRGHYYPFSSSDVFCVLRAVKKVFEGEPPMVPMKVPCVVVGDIHGQYVDLARIFEMFTAEKTPGFAKERYVFLGDYVDRGRQSLEVVMVLFMLKVIYPNKFALLRGNHECRAINKAYGFYTEIKERFLDPAKAMDIFENFNDVFANLPVACIVAGSILCMHGGISSKMKSREDISKVPKPLKDVASNPIATDLLWADPMDGLPGEMKNKVRGVSVYFGEPTLDQVMTDLNIKLVIRGHQMMMNGFNFFHNKLITVFSAAAYYPDKPNRGAVVTIDSSGRVAFKVIAPFKDDEPGILPKIFRGEHDVANTYDEGHVKVATPVDIKKLAEESGGKHKKKT